MKSYATKRSFQLGKTWRNRLHLDWTDLFSNIDFQPYCPLTDIAKSDVHKKESAST